MADMSMLAPPGMGPGGPPAQGPPAGGMPAKGMPAQGAKGMNPGGMEGFKGAIQFLLQQGLSPEEILQACLKIAADLGLNVPEDQLRQMIEGASAGQGAGQGAGAGGPAMGGAPGGAPPMGVPGMGA